MNVSLIAILLAGVIAQEPAPVSVPLCPAEQPEFRTPDRERPPQYPKAALKAGSQGTVQLKVVVGTDGKIKDLMALSGPEIFEKPSLDAVRKWRFYPVLINNQPAETTYTVAIRFDLLLQAAVPRIILESPHPPEPALPDLPVLADSAGRPVSRVTPGSGVIGPKVVYQVDPEFPQEERPARTSEKVVVTLIVDSDGTPHDLRLRCGAPAGFNEKALDAVKHWRFSPATKNGVPVSVEVDVEVEFTSYLP
jgi:TonB family protein